MLDAMERRLKQYTEEIAKIYGKHLKSVILYGSYARGDYTEDSDIDIMILLDLTDMEIKSYRHDLSDMTYDLIWIMIWILNLWQRTRIILKSG